MEGKDREAGKLKNSLEQVADEAKKKKPFLDFLMRFCALTSWIWYPFVWILVATAVAIANADLPEKQLSQLIWQIQLTGILAPIALFAICFCYSDWFRRNCIWILAGSIIIVGSSGTTAGSINHTIMGAAQSTAKQLKALEKQDTDRQKPEH